MGNDQILRESRRDALAKAEELLKITEEQGRGMSEDEKRDFDANMAEAKRLAGELENNARAKAAREEFAQASTYGVPDVARSVPVESAPRDERIPRVQVFENEHRAYQKGDAFGAIVTGRILYAPYERTQALQWARQLYGGESHPCYRALQQSTFTAGGALIPENFVGAEFIELLRARAAVRRAGARSVTLTNGTFTTPRLTGGVTGGWIGAEGDVITTSEPTFGQLVLTEKKYGVIVPFSNDLRRNASVDAIRVVRDDMVTATANDEDVAFLKGSGLAGQPMGIYNWVGAAGRGNSAGTSLANVRTDIRTAKNALANANSPKNSRAWFAHSRGINYMAWDLVDGNSNFAFPSLQTANPTINGEPLYEDNNISITLGGGTSSEIYYVEMSECFIGDSMDMEIEIFNNAVYSQSGVVRSGISRDESAIRLIRKTDFGMRHTTSAYVLEAVAYGA